MSNWTDDQVALLGDSRLSPEARIVGLMMSHQEPDEDGFAPCGYDALRELLPTSSDEKIQLALRQLRACGWAERRAGGRGHPDRYRFLDAAPGPTYPQIRWGLREHLKNRCRLREHLNPLDAGSPGSYDARSSCREEVVVGEEEDARARDAFDLSDEARAAIDEVDAEGSSVLEGCRGALADYLRQRVPTDRQHAYVRSLQAWLSGGSGMPRNLLTVRNPTHLLATALNELGTEDELTFRSARGQVGVTATLRTKVEHLIREELRSERSNGNGTTSGAAGATRGEPGSGEGPAQRTVHVER